ncbi:selenocysteine-specific translation elongation factor [Dactylosporangium matsuzakiense]|uniref:Selenocysteine-specific translation elongation factor n=1 Tax=Dactylosporangium matsuzakiense TaxID=53360 RepID=A0A9W6KGD1_9ACTN|nr:selenocysteine-specific translation elongation factor [Dactylosporangium matsuzakiense]UWZ47566.1 selenocysteine-specific translation elongation factor [Dactylosporangium matsuzakiense]GLL01606.1 selenocysteine-specific translation elongation factor [Dactylosporangium matsuzakiense]
MFVVATAGHVDHGKSTLVRALTGMEPDRWAEERRRGMTIDLGYAWTSLPSGATAAFVDVPGHERFVPNMLAGVGPVPAAMFVVAADEGWKPQSAEHLAALDALGVRHALLVVSRADLADPARATAEALTHLAKTSLGPVEAVAVSAVTGAGLDELRAALDRLGAALPPPDREAPVRLWVDRAFTIRGSGTVVTGTLGAGRLTADSALELHGSGVRVRALQSLGAAVSTVDAVARVAVNLRGVQHTAVSRGDALVAPGRFVFTALLDARIHGDPVADLPSTVVLHIGSAAVPARVRPLGVDTARLRLDRPLPLHLGDRALLRDPGRHRVPGGLTVLDVAPPPLRRRGAAAARAAELSMMDGCFDLPGELRRRRLIHADDLLRMGFPVPGAGWRLDPAYEAELRVRLRDEVRAYGESNPLDPTPSAEVLRQRLGLPDRALVARLHSGPLGTGAGLPAPVARAVAAVRTDLAANPFAAPEAARLSALGLGPKELGAAAKAGLLLRIADGIVLLPDAPAAAVERLAVLPQPFTLSEARQALGTTRRVAVPLLEFLHRRGSTIRLADGRHAVNG